MQKKPVLAITMGDVNGIGPEILAKALARPEPWQWCRPLAIGSLAAYENARHMAPGAPPARALQDPREPLSGERNLPLFDGGHKTPPLQPGMLDPEAGRCAAEWVKIAVQLAKDRTVDGMVTCPISKDCIRQAGYAYSGHTSLIADLTDAPDYRMCLFTPTMRILHITAHLSLRDAIDAVTADRIVTSIRIGHEALARLGNPSPRIAVAGLNPHAGEAGAFGREEIDAIAPAVQICQQEGIACSGPYPPDTLFGKMRDGLFDMIIAMYHDQGHIPLKLIAMDEGVNVTLGIPIVRTSVDHGTAFEIAGPGIAREHSLCAALELAAQFARCPAGRSTP